LPTLFICLGVWHPTQVCFSGSASEARQYDSVIMQQKGGAVGRQAALEAAEQRLYAQE